MNRVLVMVLLCVFLLLPSLAVCDDNQSDWTGNLNLLVGTKMLNSDNWAPIDDQIEGGVLLDFRKKDWPVNVVVDFLYSYDDEEYYGFDVEASDAELDLGVRKIFENRKFQPFFGVGFSIIWEKVEVSYLSDEETGFGVWLESGVKYLITDHFSMGLNLRLSTYRIDDEDMGGTHIGALLGYHW